MEKNDADNNLEELAGIAKVAAPKTQQKGNQGLKELAGIIEDNDNANENNAANASAE